MNHHPIQLRKSGYRRRPKLFALSLRNRARGLRGLLGRPLRLPLDPVLFPSVKIAIV
jgi:hypothetical protein